MCMSPTGNVPFRSFPCHSIATITPFPCCMSSLFANCHLDRFTPSHRMASIDVACPCFGSPQCLHLELNHPRFWYCRHTADFPTLSAKARIPDPKSNFVFKFGSTPPASSFPSSPLPPTASAAFFPSDGGPLYSLIFAFSESGSVPAQTKRKGRKRRDGG